MKPHDDDWSPQPDSLGRFRAQQEPGRFWCFPKTKARFKVLLEALLDAVDPWSECVVPLSQDGGVCFDLSERELLLHLLLARSPSPADADIQILPDHRRQSIFLSHHDVAWVVFSDAARIPSFVAAMAERGFLLPDKAPDSTFKPQSWMRKDGVADKEVPFEFAEGEPIVPWSGSLREGPSKECRWNRGPQAKAWLYYWYWSSHGFDYPEDGKLVPLFLDLLLRTIEPWTEVAIPPADPDTEQSLCFVDNERSELVAWLAARQTGGSFELIPQHGRDFLRFNPRHKRVEGVFSEPGRRDASVRLLAREGLLQSAFPGRFAPWHQTTFCNSADGPCSLRVTFDSPRNRHIPILRVNVQQPAGYQVTQLTEAEGFEAQGLAAGTYWLRLDARGTPFVSRWYRDAELWNTARADALELVPGETEVRFVLTRGRSISGRVTLDRPGEDRFGWVAARRIDIDSDVVPRACPFWGDHCDYTIEGLDPGRYSIELVTEPGTSSQSRKAITEVDVIERDICGLAIDFPGSTGFACPGE